MRYLLSALVLVCNHAVAQVGVDLMELNREYVKVVQEHRAERSHKKVEVLFDQNMLPGTVAHAYAMQAKEDLYHDKTTYNAEMIGTIYDIEDYAGNPRKLAEYIFKQFDESKAGHSELQINPLFVYVSVCCTKGYFCVRMNEVPDSVHSELVAEAKRVLNTKKGS